MSQGVYILGGKCPGGKCPGGKCPGGICPWGKCPGGTCPGGLCPRTVQGLTHGRSVSFLIQYLATSKAGNYNVTFDPAFIMEDKARLRKKCYFIAFPGGEGAGCILDCLWSMS